MPLNLLVCTAKQVSVKTSSRISRTGAFSVGKINDEQRFDVGRLCYRVLTPRIYIFRPPSPSRMSRGRRLRWNVYVSPVRWLDCMKLHSDLYRANTMSSALEVLGMSLPYSSSIPALYPGGRSEFIYSPPGLTHRNNKRKRKNVTELLNTWESS